ncbi:hypothetical protein FHETE_5297 [Fusarium heterosporum]|uniref:Uncharacterized protein n=1 Tax=Fusarium heterosporum TaxID=42747 RepID=A0A8H5TEQ4_FUSHE|nr:hypothetical protein FHETE_5297 [Fusarium heterosporum]
MMRRHCTTEKSLSTVGKATTDQSGISRTRKVTVRIRYIFCIREEIGTITRPIRNTDQPAPGGQIDAFLGSHLSIGCYLYEEWEALSVEVDSIEASSVDSRVDSDHSIVGDADSEESNVDSDSVSSGKIVAATDPRVLSTVVVDPSSNNDDFDAWSENINQVDSDDNVDAAEIVVDIILENVDFTVIDSDSVNAYDGDEIVEDAVIVAVVSKNEVVDDTAVDVLEESKVAMS